MQQERPERMISRREVQALVPVSTATLYRMMARREFPAQHRISQNRVAWIEREVLAWQADFGANSLAG